MRLEHIETDKGSVKINPLSNVHEGAHALFAFQQIQGIRLDFIVSVLFPVFHVHKDEWYAVLIHLIQGYMAQLQLHKLVNSKPETKEK